MRLYFSEIRGDLYLAVYGGSFFEATIWEYMESMKTPPWEVYTDFWKLQKLCFGDSFLGVFGQSLSEVYGKSLLQLIGDYLFEVFGDSLLSLETLFESL